VHKGAADPVAALVLYANAADVDTVLVGGRVVKRGGRLVGVDWPELAARLVRSSERVRAGFATVPLAEIESLAASLML
jgi:cytosine/adenosine deaminase-related metal-dependent hydrolase